MYVLHTLQFKTSFRCCTRACATHMAASSKSRRYTCWINATAATQAYNKCCLLLLLQNIHINLRHIGCTTCQQNAFWTLFPATNSLLQPSLKICAFSLLSPLPFPVSLLACSRPAACLPSAVWLLRVFICVYYKHVYLSFS